MIGVAKLQVEFKRDDGGLYPVNVLELGPPGPNGEPGGILLRFEDSWQADGWYPIEQPGLYESPPTRTPDQVADRLKIPCAVETLYRVKQGSPEAWYRGQVSESKNGLYTVDLQLTPPRRIHLPIEHLRLFHEPVPLTKDSIQRKVVQVPDDLVEEAATEQQLLMLARLGRLDHVQYDPAAKCIVVLVVGQAASQRVDAVLPAHMRYAAARRDLRLQIAKTRQDLFPVDETCFYKLEFNVPPERLNSSVGYDCRNLSRARALPGIVRIVLEDSGHYTVVSKDEHSMKEARELLDVGTEIVFVDQPFVGQLIGKKGENIKHIIGLTSVHHLGIHDTADSAKRANVDLEWREGFAAFVIVGSRADIDAAKMLIEYQLDHNRQLETAYSQRGPRAQRVPPRGELSRQGTEEHGSDGGVPVVDNAGGRPRENRPVNGPPQNERGGKPAPNNNNNNNRNNANNSANTGPGPSASAQTERYGQAGPSRNQNSTDNQTGQYENQGRRGSGQNGRPEDQNQNYRGNNTRRGGPRQNGPGGGYSGDYQRNSRPDENAEPRRETSGNNTKQQNVEPASSAREMNGHREDGPSDEGFTQAGNRKKKGGRNRGPGAPGPSVTAGDRPQEGQ